METASLTGEEMGKDRRGSASLGGSDMRAKTKTVLLVEDEEAHAEIICGTFEQDGSEWKNLIGWRRAEEEFGRYVMELERVNHDLNDFAVRVSHDLKAPLRTIQAFSMLLMEDYADVLDETGRGHLGELRKAAERMSLLIEDLLKISLVGRKFTTLEKVDLNALLEEIKANLRAQIKERSGEVVVEKLPDIFTVRVEMKELLTNLIDNGLKFNKSDKPQVAISCGENEKRYVFKVKDNGIGIAENYKAKIFNPFERLHSQSEYEGTGAGLAICKKIVEDLGGTIGIKSKLGEGSTFFFTIPRN